MQTSAENTPLFEVFWLHNQKLFCRKFSVLPYGLALVQEELAIVDCEGDHLDPGGSRRTQTYTNRVFCFTCQEAEGKFVLTILSGAGLRLCSVEAGCWCWLFLLQFVLTVEFSAGLRLCSVGLGCWWWLFLLHENSLLISALSSSRRRRRPASTNEGSIPTFREGAFSP